MLAQLRLAWWRDMLDKPQEQWPRGEPLLAQLRETGHDPRPLISMVDGWEALLSEPQPRDTAIAACVAGRASGWAWLGSLAGRALPAEDIATAGSEWALTDLAGWAGDTEARAVFARMADEYPWTKRAWSPALRPLAILHGLALRARRRRSLTVLDGPASLAIAMRLGILGR